MSKTHTANVNGLEITIELGNSETDYDVSVYYPDFTFYLKTSVDIETLDYLIDFAGSYKDRDSKYFIALTYAIHWLKEYLQGENNE